MSLLALNASALLPRDSALPYFPYGITGEAVSYDNTLGYGQYIRHKPSSYNRMEVVSVEPYWDIVSDGVDYTFRIYGSRERTSTWRIYLPVEFSFTEDGLHTHTYDNTLDISFSYVDPYVVGAGGVSYYLDADQRVVPLWQTTTSPVTPAYTDHSLTQRFTALDFSWSNWSTDLSDDYYLVCEVKMRLRVYQDPYKPVPVPDLPDEIDGVMDNTTSVLGVFSNVFSTQLIIALFGIVAFGTAFALVVGLAKH